MQTVTLDICSPTCIDASYYTDSDGYETPEEKYLGYAHSLVPVDEILEGAALVFQMWITSTIQVSCLQRHFVTYCYIDQNGIG
jgi:hypothetical protein